MRMYFLTGKEAYEVFLFSALNIHSLICLYTNSLDVNNDAAMVYIGKLTTVLSRW